MKEELDEVLKQVDIKNIEVLVAKNDDGVYLTKNFKFDTKRQRFTEISNV